jgi:hypothetical protein
MATVIVWTATGASVLVAFTIALWASFRFASTLPKIAFFVAACLFGIILFSIVSALLATVMPVDADLLHTAVRKQALTVTVGVVIAAYVGAWQVRRIVLGMSKP